MKKWSSINISSRFNCNAECMRTCRLTVGEAQPRDINAKITGCTEEMRRRRCDWRLQQCYLWGHIVIVLGTVRSWRPRRLQRSFWNW